MEKMGKERKLIWSINIHMLNEIYYYTPIRLAKTKNLTVVNVDKIA